MLSPASTSGNTIVLWRISSNMGSCDGAAGQLGENGLGIDGKLSAIGLERIGLPNVDIFHRLAVADGKLPHILGGGGIGRLLFHDGWCRFPTPFASTMMSLVKSVICSGGGIEVWACAAMHGSSGRMASASARSGWRYDIRDIAKAIYKVCGVVFNCCPAGARCYQENQALLRSGRSWAAIQGQQKGRACARPFPFQSEKIRPNNTS